MQNLNPQKCKYPQILPISALAKLLLPILKLAGILTQRYGYRGIGRICLIFEKIFPPLIVKIVLSAKLVFEIDLRDYYWSRMIFKDFKYEPEILSFVKSVLPKDFAWIDCGANMGYWSVIISSMLPPDRVFAVEASPDSFKKLKRNWELNGSRFQIFHNAISDTDEKILLFDLRRRHAAARIIKSEKEAQGRIVETKSITIDKLIRETPLNNYNGPIVLKLDIEGAEYAAINGAAKTFAKKNIIIIYECHGSDQECISTSFLLAQGHHKIFSLTSGFPEIHSISDAQAIKSIKCKGYNFVAVPAQFNFSKIKTESFLKDLQEIN
ncbi:FkbM family methyltransferase [Desulfovibrio gilichinskyi]|uniref:Methyltransferase, FkbM family n=1 Tax=Desulfovibrio gilichinskyi TaxID=1519643 RepID=A0A1X7C686_9BACT|nr:FkbM family methyltransferase [Desulfovibrio gilichinskyi]SME90749.1 methyltransferase, FkbM family [Desulfovibrio gilichinskyi]